MSTTLDEAKAELRSKVRDGGGDCPCCTQFVKIYRRPLNAQMTRWLIGLVRVHSRTGDWVHVDEIGASLGLGKHAHPADFAKLRYWGLIVQQPNDDPTKRTSGCWMPTQNGRAFVYGRLTVPSHCVLYNSKLMRLEGKERDVRRTLGKEFDYAELMRDLPDWLGGVRA